MNPDNPNFRTPEEERRAEELVKARETIAELRVEVEYLNESIADAREAIGARSEDLKVDIGWLIEERDELRAEVERLKNERKVQEFRIQSHEPVMEQLDLDLQRTLRRNVKLSETIARQARVIEKLMEQRDTVIKAANQDGLEYGNPKNWDKELDAIGKEEK